MVKQVQRVMMKVQKLVRETKWQGFVVMIVQIMHERWSVINLSERVDTSVYLRRNTYTSRKEWSFGQENLTPRDYLTRFLQDKSGAFPNHSGEAIIISSYWEEPKTQHPTGGWVCSNSLVFVYFVGSLTSPIINILSNEMSCGNIN